MPFEIEPYTQQYTEECSQDKCMIESALAAVRNDEPTNRSEWGKLTKEGITVTFTGMI